MSENFLAKPRYNRSGYADKRYTLAFFLDSIIAFLVGFVPLLIHTNFSSGGGENWAQLISQFIIFQFAGQIIVWFYISRSFRWHHVRHWWFHLVLHVWFAAMFQAGSAVFIWGRMLEAASNPANDENIVLAILIGWLVWITLMVLIAKSFGLWLTLHEACRVHYQGLGWAKETMYYFDRNCGQKLVGFLEQKNGDGVRSLLLDPPDRKPVGLKGYTLVTISSPNDDDSEKLHYLHLKEIFCSFGYRWDKRHHRAPGFSRLHHVEFTRDEMAEIEKLMKLQ